MANPQVENGFTRIANEILEVASMAKFNGTQFKIVMTIWRYTYGFNRKDSDFSLSFLSNATNVNKQQIKRELDKLIEDKIIIITKKAGFNNSRKLSFNKNYTQWRVKGIVSTKESTVSELADTTVSELADTTVSELEYQERKNKESIKESPHIDYFEKIWGLYPNKKGKGKISDSKKKELFKIGEELERCIRRYDKYVKKERKSGFQDLEYQYGSSFFNSGYVDYLDSNYSEEEKVKDRPPLKFVIRDRI